MCVFTTLGHQTLVGNSINNIDPQEGYIPGRGTSLYRGSIEDTPERPCCSSQVLGFSRTVRISHPSTELSLIMTDVVTLTPLLLFKS